MRSEIEQEIAVIVRTLGWAPEGPICKSILVPSEALSDESGAELVQATVDFTNWAMEDARLSPGEFPSEALCAYYADYYLAQVNNGGHKQWACNSDFHPLAVRSAGWGLEAMGALKYFAIHQEFVRLMDDPHFAGNIFASAFNYDPKRYEQPWYARESDLNSRFFALDPDHSYPMLKMSADWLKSLGLLQALEPRLLEDAKASAIAANAHHKERQRRALAAHNKAFFYWAPRKLCTMAGVEFFNLTAGAAVLLQGQKQFAWFMQTSGGLMAMVMRNSSIFPWPTAKLYRTDGIRVTGPPLAQVALSKSDYDRHVPPKF